MQLTSRCRRARKTLADQSSQSPDIWGGFDELDFSSIAEVALKRAFEPVHLNESATAGPDILSLIQNVECAVRLHEQLRLLPGSDLDSPTLTGVKCC